VQAETLTPSVFNNQTQQPGLHDLLITPKDNFIDKEERETTGLTEKEEGLGDFSQEVDHTPESQIEQDIQPALPNISDVDHLPLESGEITELVGFIQTAIETGDRELAKNIQDILKATVRLRSPTACGTDADDEITLINRRRVWEALTKTEQVAFTALVRLEQDYAHRILQAIDCKSKAVARAINLNLQRDITAGKTTEAAIANIVGQSFQEF
jgi:hypothetical protein